MNNRAILLLVIFASLALAGTPTTGEVNLRLRDVQQRPILNASVTFEYMATDPILGELHKTDVHYSNQFGVVEKRLSADFNTPYKITISHHNAEQVLESTWTGGFDRFINLPLADFSVRVVDQQGNPIPRVPLRVEVSDSAGFLTEANGTGYAIFYQYDRGRVYTIHAKYGSVETPIEVVPDAQLHTIQIPTYVLEIRAFNENASALVTEMQVSYFGVEEMTRNGKGISRVFSQIPEGNVTITLKYGNRTLHDVFYLNYSTAKSYTFDLTPPIISTPRISPEKPIPENEVLVFAQIADPGTNPSGMPPLVNMIPPAELYYSLDAVEWLSVHMFPEPGNTSYKARIPGLPRDSVVRYYVVAWDNANNTATSPQYTFNTFTGGEDGKPPALDILGLLAPYWSYWWVLAVIAVIAAAYFVKKKYL